MKYYAVRYTDNTTEIIHNDWVIAKQKIQGVSGVKFKSFAYKEDAEAWIGMSSSPNRTSDTPYEKDTYYIFTDGSYNDKLKESGWGYAIIYNNEVLHHDSGATKEHIESRNICGELEAVVQAVKWFEKHITTGTKPVIVYDYEGIREWAVGAWDANKPVSSIYQTYMKDRSSNYAFEKVKGHTNIYWNEYVDKLAGGKS